ncbi:MAG: divalent-cation tolerance protein CutA [Thermodesulfobacteriota bacterium]|nr:divalent-cation tolerance protein CutA [Thermodesulfobacteriota bacterium]
MTKEYIQVFVTTEKREDAEKIAGMLVRNRMAGCTQIVGPIVSQYWWKGNIEKAQEWLCFIKTKKNLYDKIENMVKEIHPYETPEIIALPIVDGSKEYFKWLDDEVKD